jgi:hypothetical protein
MVISYMQRHKLSTFLSNHFIDNNDQHTLDCILAIKCVLEGRLEDAITYCPDNPLKPNENEKIKS